MAGYEQKTRPTDLPVEQFLSGIEHAGRVEDARRVIALMEEITGEPPVMWGPSIIGFGRYAYTYDSGHSGEANRIGLSPRKANLVVYLHGMNGPLAPMLERLGKHRRGGGCLYLNRLRDVDEAVLREMIGASWAHMAERYP
jgi:hypothetical protein